MQLPTALGSIFEHYGCRMAEREQSRDHDNRIVMDLAGQPDPQLMQHVEREFELRFMKCKGTAFQDFFSELMEMAFPSNFCRVRPHGKTGDLKCDGYLTSEKTVFQVYGPDEIRSLPRLLSKLAEDFNGACHHWSDRMAKWVFVHNSRGGLPAQALQVLEHFRTIQAGLEVESWGFEELRGVLWKIESRRLELFFPLRNGVDSSIPSFTLPSPADLEKYLTWIRARTRIEEERGPLKPTTIMDLPVRLADPSLIATFHSPHTTTRNELRYENNDWHNRFHRKTISSSDLQRILRDHPRVLVEGDAGSGKTTLLRQVARHEAKRGLKRLTRRRRSSRTPVLVELARIAAHRTLEQLILSAIAEASVQLDSEAFHYLATRGYFIFLLDGLDEVPQSARRECLAQIKDLSEQYPSSKIIVTSRRFPQPVLPFHALGVVPLCEADIVHVMKHAFGTMEEFQKHFSGGDWEGSVRLDAESYVRLKLRPEIKRICERPLMLRMVVSLLRRESTLPKSLYGVYSRFLEWTFYWEELHEKAASVALCLIALEELASLAIRRAPDPVLRGEWTEAIVNRLRCSQDQAFDPIIQAEFSIKWILSTGLILVLDGEVHFSHRSFQEFFIAKWLLKGPLPPDTNQFFPDMGISRFLCGALPDITELLNVHLAQCESVEELKPLLEEGSNAGCAGGEFEDLFWAIGFAEEMEIHLSHSAPGEWTETFAETIDEIVRIAVIFRPKALSILYNTAIALIIAVQWDHSGQWFEHLMKGFDQYDWPGTPYLRQFANAGFFEHVDRFAEDGTLKKEANYEALRGFVDALDENKFDKAEEQLAIILRVLRPRKKARRSPRINANPGQESLPFGDLIN
jgi:hypothetical protein